MTDGMGLGRIGEWFSSTVAGGSSLYPAAAFADPIAWEPWHHMLWDGWWGHRFFLGPVLWLVFVAAIVALVVRLWRRPDRGQVSQVGGKAPPAEDVPIQILRERFARGEIDRREFDERRQVLEG